VRTLRTIQRQGFTLVELLLVLVILAVLAAMIIPKFTKRSEQARIAAATSDIANLGTALDAFEIDIGRYPTSDEGLKALFEQPSNAKDWKGYLKKPVGNDPWGHAYVYRAPGSHNATSYDLYSYGPDGNEGGGDDIDNWSQK
jgi:general secretion pathway protein G